jgi:hypothetical protein
VRRYRSIGEPAAHLPEIAQRRWAHYGLFPNNVLAVTPESVQFYQALPLGVGRTLLRGRVNRSAARPGGRGQLATSPSGSTGKPMVRTSSSPFGPTRRCGPPPPRLPPVGPRDRGPRSPRHAPCGAARLVSRREPR